MEKMNEIQSTQLTSLWKTTQKYCRISLTKDMFGMWMVVRQWGVLESERYKEKTKSYSDYSSALGDYRSAERRRKSEGYSESG
jgi:hypothetical protein